MSVCDLQALLIISEKNPPSLEDYGVLRLCFCQTTKPSEIDVEKIELQQVRPEFRHFHFPFTVILPKYLYLLQIVSHGNFATVWLGKYQESLVAVKVFPAGLKHKFAAEKEVFELPLMRHAGIIHFLGTGRKPDRDSWLIVLQFAEYVSGNQFKVISNIYLINCGFCYFLRQEVSITETLRDFNPPL